MKNCHWNLSHLIESVIVYLSIEIADIKRINILINLASRSFILFRCPHRH